MRKRVLSLPEPASATAALNRVGADQIEEVEISSEAVDHPIERALEGEQSGWRAAGPGAQVIRLRFHHDLRLDRVRLVIREEEMARTQEFSLAVSKDHGRSYQPLVRQQFTFSPPTTTEEVEEYVVQQDGITNVELRLAPDIGGGPAVASLAEWRIYT